MKRLSVSATVVAGGINYTYDSFNRLSSKTSDFYVIEYTGTRFTNTVGYTYETAANNGLTYPRVASYTSQVNNNAATVYRYSYDDSGNITQISDGNNVIQYLQRTESGGRF